MGIGMNADSVSTNLPGFLLWAGSGKGPLFTCIVVTPSDQGGAGGVVCLCRYNLPATSDLESRLFPLWAEPIRNTRAQFLSVFGQNLYICQVDFKRIKQGVSILHLNLTLCKIFGLFRWHKLVVKLLNLTPSDFKLTQ